jgi:hypothetical protein
VPYELVKGIGSEDPLHFLDRTLLVLDSGTRPN